MATKPATKPTTIVEGPPQLVATSIGAHLRKVFALDETAPEHLLRLARQLEQEESFARPMRSSTERDRAARR